MRAFFSSVVDVVDQALAANGEERAIARLINMHKTPARWRLEVEFRLDRPDKGYTATVTAYSTSGRVLTQESFTFRGTMILWLPGFAERVHRAIIVRPENVFTAARLAYRMATEGWDPPPKLR